METSQISVINRNFKQLQKEETEVDWDSVCHTQGGENILVILYFSNLQNIVVETLKNSKFLFHSSVNSWDYIWIFFLED